jgi:hypothetical protein
MPDHAARQTHSFCAVTPPSSAAFFASAKPPAIAPLTMAEAGAVTAAAALLRATVPQEAEVATSALVEMLRPTRPDLRRLIGAALVELALEQIRQQETA